MYLVYGYVCLLLFFVSLGLMQCYHVSFGQNSNKPSHSIYYIREQHQIALVRLLFRSLSAFLSFSFFSFSTFYGVYRFYLLSFELVADTAHSAHINLSICQRVLSVRIHMYLYTLFVCFICVAVLMLFICNIRCIVYFRFFAGVTSSSYSSDLLHLFYQSHIPLSGSSVSICSFYF